MASRLKLKDPVHEDPTTPDYILSIIERRLIGMREVFENNPAKYAKVTNNEGVFLVSVGSIEQYLKKTMMQNHGENWIKDMLNDALDKGDTISFSLAAAEKGRGAYRLGTWGKRKKKKKCYKDTMTKKNDPAILTSVDWAWTKKDWEKRMEKLFPSFLARSIYKILEDERETMFLHRNEEVQIELEPVLHELIRRTSYLPKKIRKLYRGEALIRKVKTISGGDWKYNLTKLGIPWGVVRIIPPDKMDDLKQVSFDELMEGEGGAQI